MESSSQSAVENGEEITPKNPLTLGQFRRATKHLDDSATLFFAGPSDECERQVTEAYPAAEVDGEVFLVRKRVSVACNAVSLYG